MWLVGTAMAIILPAAPAWSPACQLRPDPSCSHPSLVQISVALSLKIFLSSVEKPSSHFSGRPIFSYMNPEPFFCLLMTLSSTHSTLFHPSAFWWHCSLLQGSALDWMLMVPQNPMLKHNPQCDVLAFGRWWDHEGSGITKGMSALKRDPGERPHTFLHVRAQCFSLTVNKKWALIGLWIYWHLHLGHPTLQNGEK